MTTTFPLSNLDGFTTCHVIPSVATHRGKSGLRLELTADAETPDCPNFALLDGVDFGNGTIEVEVAGQPLPDAAPSARGFIGIAFRIAADHSKFECIYLRPTNGRADNQLRRNRSVQYFSYPDFKFDRLRDEAAGEYETYADLETGAWTRMRIEVQGQKAMLFVGDVEQPTLIVSDLKHGADLTGGIGLYIDNGTEGFFRDLRVTP